MKLDVSYKNYKLSSTITVPISIRDIILNVKQSLKISDINVNVIDEIEFNQSKLSQSFNNFAAFNNNHFQQGHVSRKNTTSTLSQVSNQNLLFIQPQFFFNQMNPRSFSANQLPNQNLYFNTNNQYDYKFNSFNALHNTNSIPFNPNAISLNSFLF